MPANPDRLHAALADRYRIERELGSGGMATVYLAQDLKHARPVAIKVLKPELAAVLGAERFVQEIRTTAALSHPHILPLFDSGEAAGFLYYVMPYIEGETIREKLTRETQLGIQDAVRIATEVADALDYAHRHGVIHRDIKPENILLHDGRAMVMDFGIALAVSAAAGGRMTETGLSLGTPHYMSPEQATADKQITARSDIYSLASVLYEMLAGEPPHMGNSAQQIIMKIIAERAQLVTALRQSVPPNVAAALAKALEKLPADRFESAKAFAEALDDPHFASTHRAGAETSRPAASRVPLIAGYVLSAILLVVAVIGWLRRPEAAAAPTTRFVEHLPNGYRFLSDGGALSGDGRMLAYPVATPGGDRLLIRSLDQVEARAFDVTARQPFFSPDNQWVGYFSLAALEKVPVGGGRPLRVATEHVPLLWAATGGAWFPDGAIVYSHDGALWTVPADGGTPAQLTTPDTAAGERSHSLPRVLPDGRALFTLDTKAGRQPAVLDRQAGRWQALPVRGVALGYLATGHLVYAQQGLIYRVPFSLAPTKITGPPTVVGAIPALQSRPAISSTGVMAYVPARSADQALVWFDRSGSPTQATAKRAAYEWPRLSPDGRRVAFGRRGPRGWSVWVLDLMSGGETRLNDGGEAIWSPDGTRVAFWGNNLDLYWQRADGSAPAERLATSDNTDNGQAPTSWSPDGGTIAFYRGSDIWTLSMRDRTAKPLIATPAFERAPMFSPNGRYLAYTSDESGQNEIYVQPYPGLGAKWTVSVGGGFDPVWSRDGKELFYLNGNQLMAVSVALEPAFSAQPPRRLFAASFEISANGDQSYDVSPDGRRFLMIQGGNYELHVLMNWHAELTAGTAAARTP